MQQAIAVNGYSCVSIIHYKLTDITFETGRTAHQFTGTSADPNVNVASESASKWTTARACQVASPSFSFFLHPHAKYPRTFYTRMQNTLGHFTPACKIS